MNFTVRDCIQYGCTGSAKLYTIILYFCILYRARALYRVALLYYRDR
jgi:hypothetical protein